MAPHSAPSATQFSAPSSELQDDAIYNFDVNVTNFFDHHKTGSTMSSHNHSPSNLSAARMSEISTSRRCTSIFSPVNNESMDNLSFFNDFNPSRETISYNDLPYYNLTQDILRYIPALPSLKNANMNTHSFVNCNTDNVGFAAYNHLSYSFSAAENSPLYSSCHHPATGTLVNNNIHQENMEVLWHPDYPNITNEVAPYSLSSHSYSMQDKPSLSMSLPPSRQYAHTSPAINNSNTYPFILPRATFFQLPRFVQVLDLHEGQRRRIEYLDYLMDHEAAIRAKIMINETNIQALERRARKLERTKGMSVSGKPVHGFESPEKKQRLLSQERENEELRYGGEGGDVNLFGQNGVGEHIDRVGGAEEGQEDEKQRKTSTANAELYRKVEEVLEELITHYEVAQQRIQRNEARIEWIRRELEIQEERETYALETGTVTGENEEVEVPTSGKHGMPFPAGGGGRVFKESPRKRAKY